MVIFAIALLQRNEIRGVASFTHTLFFLSFFFLRERDESGCAWPRPLQTATEDHLESNDILIDEILNTVLFSCLKLPL